MLSVPANRSCVTSRGVSMRHVGASGFTLIELMVSIAIVGTLIAITLPTLGVSREQSRVLICTSNTRQLTSGMLAFSVDSRGGHYVRDTQVGDDSLAYLVADGYMTNEQAVLCPVTQNQLDRSLPIGRRLASAARHAHDASGGHSYETFHHYSRGQFPGFVFDDNRQLNTRDSFIAPEHGFIVLDADNDPGGGGDNGGYYGYNNLPDEATNNHGASGMNIAFLDGSARFVPGGQWIGVNIAAGHMDGESTDMVRAKRLFEPRLQWDLRRDGGPGLRYWLD